MEMMSAFCGVSTRDASLLEVRTLFTVVCVLDSRLQDALHLHLTLLVRGHLACDQHLASLQRDLGRRPTQNVSIGKQGDMR